MKLNRSETVTLAVLIVLEIGLSATIYYKFVELGQWKWLAVWAWFWLTAILIGLLLPSDSILHRDQTGDRPER